MATAAPDVQPLNTDSDRPYTCTNCGGTFPVEAMMSHSKRRAGGGRIVYYGPRCRRCENQRKRDQERRLAAAPRAEDGTIIEPVLETDPQPAQLLVELLADSRRIGLPFNAVFEEHCALAVRDLKPAEQQSWLEALRGTRKAWQRGYERQDVCRLDPTLLAMLSGSRPCVERP